jgi:hypothetical protein
MAELTADALNPLAGRSGLLETRRGIADISGRLNRNLSTAAT